ncbi:GntR family transcriptional regulator [Paraburkholderia dipogonis]|uniref:GntR family transcriptional regulator n=1 Tax=Paraburkholderia dipogonis TaxID=1211383 RepID=A0A4Y8MHB8_9BURK|nr:GntR family transcriptional regulator [Paraburkholderia dipogonis]TFE36847.1 GntR family transcriptional regulator [Paraburkholderia dipogonis]
MTMLTPLDIRPDQDAAEPKVDYAYRRLEEMIVTRQLPPGSLVSEIQLANELNVGRTPVREAFARLKHLGFVETHPRRGTLVAGVDVRKQLELLEVRRALEALVVASACARASEQQREEMNSLADQIVRAADRGDVHEYFQVNRAIHELEVAAAHNSMLTTTMQIIHAQSRRFWYVHVQQTGTFEEGAARHAAVLRAISAGDAAQANAASDELMQFLDRLTRSAIDSFR